MITQKLRRSGNSFVVTIPADEVNRLNLEEGDLVAIEVRRLQVRPELTPDVAEIFEEVWDEYAAAFRYLEEH